MPQPHFAPPNYRTATGGWAAVPDALLPGGQPIIVHATVAPGVAGDVVGPTAPRADIASPCDP